jgi:hypothetical protein
MRRLAKCVALVSPGPHAIFLILSCDDAKNERFDMKQIVTTIFGKESKLSARLIKNKQLQMSDSLVFF